MGSSSRGSRSRPRRRGTPDEDSGLVYRISNLELAAQRAHIGWEELLDLGGFRTRPDAEQYERLFEFLLRAAMYQPERHGHLFNPRNWGLDAVAGLPPRKWTDWYGRVVEVQDGRPPAGLNSTRLAEEWRSQLDAIRFLAVNYWNGLVQRPSNKIFAAWLPAHVADVSAVQTSKSATVMWDAVRGAYRELTERAENRDRKYFTANRYLFDQAPRKRIVEWRFELQQKLQSFDPHSMGTTVGPPIFTQEVKQALGVRDPESVLSSEMTQDACESYIQEVESYVDRVRAVAAHRLAQISAALSKLSPNRRLKRLKLLVREIQLLHDATNIGTQDRDHPLADYLVHLCLYLNETLCCPDDPDTAGGIWKRYLLNLNQCAFMARSLYEYYGGEAVPPADGKRGRQSFFYSIPVFVPTVKDGDLPRRTSILGMGTSERLTEPECRGWLRVSEQLILPAQQQDLAIDERVNRAYAHIDAVVHAWRWDLRSISRLLAELGKDSQHSPAGRVLADATRATGTGFRRSQLLRQILKPYYDALAQHQRLRTDGFKRLHVEPDYREAASTGAPIWVPMRLILLEALLRGLASDRCAWVIKKSDFLHLTDRDIEAELERTSPTTRWRVNLTGFDDIYVNTRIDCQPVAAWALLLEEWASNVRHHRPTLPPHQPLAEVTVIDSFEGLTCSLAFGPFSQYPRAHALPVGHGSTLIHLCANVLTQAERRRDEPAPRRPFVHGFDPARDNGTSKWWLEFTIPQVDWEEMCGR